MSGSQAAIEIVAERARGFLRDRDRKLLHIVAATELRDGVVDVVIAAEKAPDNHSPFVAFRQPHAAGQPGWNQRSTDARTQHEARAVDADPPLPELPPPPPGDDDRVGFASQLWQLLQTAPAGAEGLVVVLAPAFVEAPKIWAEAVGLLVGGRQLADVRWIVIDTEASTINPIIAALGRRALQHDARIAEANAHAELEKLVAGSNGAGPRGVTPPPRPDLPPPDDSPEAKTRADVRTNALTAALAINKGDCTAGIAAQRKARDLCANAGWTEEAIAMELVLGGDLMAAGQARAAEESFARAIDSARAANLDAKVATAGFALGAARTTRGETHTALVAYAEASIAAERSGDPILAIEGSRLAGETAADLKMEPQAITFYTRAVKLAEQGPPELALTSAAQAARGLAQICRKRGLRDRAAELEAQAQRFVKPPEPPPPPPSPPAITPAPEAIAASPIAGADSPDAIAASPIAGADTPDAIAASPIAGADSPDAIAITDRVPIAPDIATPERAPMPGAQSPHGQRDAAPPAIAPMPEAVARIARMARPDLQPVVVEPPDPAQLLGALPVPPDQVRFLPEGTALIDRKAALASAASSDAIDRPALLPPAEGTILLDDMRPPPGAAAPPPIALDEGTGLLTLEEIADLHWGGVAAIATPPAQGSRSWTKGEIAILQHAVEEALEPEATLMLSHDELAALRGEKRPTPPTDQPERPAVAAGELVVDGTPPAPPPPIHNASARARPSDDAGLEPIPTNARPTRREDDAIGLEPIPGLEPGPAPAATAASAEDRTEGTIDGDEVTMLSLADIAKMRDAIRRAQADKKEP